MENIIEVQNTIRTEISQDIVDVRGEYLKHFSNEIEQFTEGMATAFLNWRSLDEGVTGNKHKSVVSAIVYCAIALHVSSMKLFLSGNNIAAGNLQRQVLESIALALLCANKSLNILERFMEQQYSPNKAIRDVLRHANEIGLYQDALEILKKSYAFYHNYSHLTYMTIASYVSFSDEGIYVGASFDDEKLDQYKKEVKARVSLAHVFNNIVDGVKANILKW